MASTTNEPEDRPTEGSIVTAVTEGADGNGDAISDSRSAMTQEERIEALEGKLDEREAEIEELQDLLLDLSTRVADDRGVGVCPDCHGPVVTVRGLFRPSTIECKRCGRVLHEY